MESWLVYEDPEEELSYYIYSAVLSDDYSSVEKYNTSAGQGYGVYFDKATDLRTLSWGQWVVTDDDSYLVKGVDGKIECEFDIPYPEATDMPTLEGEGTEDDPYQISSATEWREIANYITEVGEMFTDTHFKLTDNIDLTTENIEETGIAIWGDYIIRFDGEIDGNGKTFTISGDTVAKVNCGALIQALGVNAKIHDFTVEGDLYCSFGCCGGVVGVAAGTLTNITCNLDIYVMYSTPSIGMTAGGIAGNAVNARFENCVFGGTLTSYHMYTGGISGYASVKASSSNGYYGCTNKGAISCMNSGCAGIVAYCNVNVEDCVNEGSITSTGSYIGGIVSRKNGASLARCTNKGTVSGSSTKGYYGGIVGYATGSTTTISECYNEASVSLDGPYAGGIVGYMQSSSAMTDCVNNGDVTCTGNYVGGVAGYVKSAYVTNCINSSEVENSTKGSSYVAGVVGYASSATISGCSNNGIVGSDYQYTGGIVGMIDAKSELSECYNTGNVTGGSTYTGGVAGSLATALDNSWNTGNITGGDYYTGGIAGYASSSLTNVYNAGIITGTDYVGGIVGAPALSSTTIATAYSSGKVVVDSESLHGNIIGVNTDNTDYWGEGNSLTDTYYLSANNAGGTDTYSAALTYADLGALEIEGWTNGDAYTYPILADNDHAKAYAAAVVPAEGDSYDLITGYYFNVGAPDGLTWAASSEAVTIDGNTVMFNESFNGTLIMTATSGDVSVDTELVCDVEVVVDGINSVKDSDKAVAKERYFTIAGTEVTEPLKGSKALYIVVKTYNDGTTSASKEIR